MRRVRESYVHRVFQSVSHVPRWMAAFAVMLALGCLPAAEAAGRLRAG